MLTVDFFTPVVDDPFDFGRLAAANALSDVFAMGGKPHVALNLLALDSALGTEVAAEILKGGAKAVRDAGAFVCGGHTIDDPEPKYGLAVFGTVKISEMTQNKGAKPGDALYLTKRLGTGIMSAAHKIERITDEQMQPVIDSMMELNDKAAAAMREARAHAATDVTGFGLAGHLHEMMASSQTQARLDFGSLPLFEEAWGLNLEYCRPNRTFSIMDLAEHYVLQGSLDEDEYDGRMGVLCDPQTSGGLLVAVAPDRAETFERTYERLAGKRAWRIGTVCDDAAGTICFDDVS